VKEIDKHTHTKEKAKKSFKKEERKNTHTQMYSFLMNLELFSIKSEVK